MNIFLLVWIVLLVGGFWLVLVRPQRAARARAATLQRTIDVGDRVVTIGGLYGRVAELGDDTMRLEVAPGVTIEVARRAIAGRVPDDDELGDDDHPVAEALPEADAAPEERSGPVKP